MVREMLKVEYMRIVSVGINKTYDIMTAEFWNQLEGSKNFFHIQAIRCYHIEAEYLQHSYYN